MKWFKPFASNSQPVQHQLERVSFSPSLAAVPPHSACFHVTHWKAGSQWILGILQELFGPAVETPQSYVDHVWRAPAQCGRVYPCVYFSKPELDSIESTGQKRYFVLIRDLRDTLVSGYFSLLKSHEATQPAVVHLRRVLTRLTREDGLLYLLETWLTQAAWIQRTWLKAKVPFYRLEDCMVNAPAVIRQMLVEGWGVTLSPELLAEIVQRHAFVKLSGGRTPGNENPNSHYRKGVAGDWRSHFTPVIADRFKALYNDLLLLGKYESTEDWSLKDRSQSEQYPSRNRPVSIPSPGVSV